MSGDWLSKLALTYLGDATRWPEIYDANKSAIENAAKAHPGPPVFGTSDQGHWIFPGTALTIPGTACAPTASTTTTTPTGEITDAQACKAKGGRPAETASGEFVCGEFGTLSVPPHQFTPEELAEVQLAANTVGCLKDVASVVAAVPGVLNPLGLAVVSYVLLADLIVTTVQDMGNQDESNWDAIKWTAKKEKNVKGVSCFRLVLEAS